MDKEGPFINLLRGLRDEKCNIREAMELLRPRTLGWSASAAELAKTEKFQRAPIIVPFHAVRQAIVAQWARSFSIASQQSMFVARAHDTVTVNKKSYRAPYRMRQHL